uniref:mitotic-spindle organizing protein 2B-like isoform X1 n=1 Tax=Myxine glutinosa TaxID=7769 RepID=UPI00358FD6AE
MTNQQPSVGCHAVDVTVSGLVRRSMKHQRKPLSGDERELHDLACLTGISLDPDVFRVILDLLKLNIAPQALMQVLRAICDSSTHQARSNKLSTRGSMGLNPHRLASRPVNRSSNTFRGRNKGQSTSASTSTGIKEKDGQQGSRPACASRQGRTGQTVSRTGVPF